MNLISGWVIAGWTLRLTFVAGAFVPAAAVYWIARFSERRISGSIRGLVSIFITVSIGLGFVSLLTPWIAQGTVRDVELGPAFAVYAIFLLAGIFTTTLLCARHYHHAEGIERLQSRYILLGVGLFGVSAFLVSGLLPALGNSAVGRLDSVSALFFVGFSAYAIVRHRLMDTRLIARLSVIYATLGVFTLAMYYGVLWLDNHVLGGSYSAWGYVSALLIVPVFLAAFGALARGIRRMANRYFFASLYDYQSVLDAFSQRVSSTIMLPEVLRAVTDTVTAAMHVEDVAVAVRKAGDGGVFDLSARIGWVRLPGELSVSAPLQRMLTEGRAPILAEDLSASPDSPSTQDADAVSLFQRHGIAVAVPFLAKGQLIAVMLLGRKLSRDAYTSQDLSLLQSIANQATVAVQNARLYAQVQDFSATLEEKVKAQTRDIEDKNERLEILLTMKSEFLSIASHQLRTPLTAIRGLLAMQADGDLDGLSDDERKRQQRNMLDSANRLSNIVNDLLDAMELEGGVPDLTFQPVDLRGVVDDVCKELKPNYDRKGLTLNVEAPPAPLPPVLADAKMFREAVENLIDNAEKYTNKGGTTVTLSQKDGSAVIAISDTGIGIPKTDMPRLFQKFSRGEKSTYQHTDGSGLGLFIAKSIIANHHGTIAIESPGEGKGTTVTVTVPLSKIDPTSA